jgi:hypothetical membrane protein
LKKQTKQIIWGVFIFLFGLFFGYAAARAGELISEGGRWLPYLNGAKALAGNMTLAVFAGSLIAYCSKAPKTAGVRAALFAAGIVVSYLIGIFHAAEAFPPFMTSLRALLYGVFVIALVAFAGDRVWHSKKTGWAAAVYAALPTGYLLSQGYRIYTGYAIQYVIPLVLAAILFILMPTQKGQRLRVLPLAILVAVILIWLDEILRFMGL